MRIEITEVQNGFIVKAAKGYWQNNDPIGNDTWETQHITKVFQTRDEMIEFVKSWKDL